MKGWMLEIFDSYKSALQVYDDKIQPMIGGININEHIWLVDYLRID